MIFDTLVSAFSPKAAAPPAITAPRSLTSSNAQARQSALAAAESAAAEQRAKQLAAADAMRSEAHLRFDRDVAEARTTAEAERVRLAAEIGAAWYAAAAPLVEAFRASGSREPAELLRVLLTSHLARVELELGAIGRAHVIAFSFARAQGRLCTDSILHASTGADIGSRVADLVKTILSSGAWSDALAALDRCVEAAPVDGDTVTFNEAALCMTDLDANHARESYLRRVRGLAA